MRNVVGYDSNTVRPDWMRQLSSSGTGSGSGSGSGSSGLDSSLGLDGHMGRIIVLELIRILTQMCLGGILFGLCMGWLCRFLLKFVYDDRFIEFSIAIGLSYGAFWVAEVLMGTSSMLTVVCMGLYMNANKSSFSPGVLHYLHSFYELMAQVLNTLIFLIAGCRLGVILGADNFEPIFSHPAFLLMVVLIYPIVLAARAVAILMVYPLIRYTGTKCSWREAVALWHGGLRGAVGLALGLAMGHTTYAAPMAADDPLSDAESVGVRECP